MSSVRPDHLVGELIDCLQQNDRPLGVLLGAGCPCSIRVDGLPLIPDVTGLTAAIQHLFEGKPHFSSWKRIQKQLLEDGISQPNLEDVLSRVRAIIPIAGTSDVRGCTLGELQTLEQEIAAAVVKLTNVELPLDVTPYEQFAGWLGGIPRRVPVELFTTNYDCLMEQAMERARVPYFDGFAGGFSPYFSASLIEEEAMPPQWVRLWKLHGSINWKVDNDVNGGSIRRSAPGEGAVIHPSHLKYDESRKMPYLAMMDRLRRFMRMESVMLITIGYSFRDQHLNEVLIESSRMNSTAFVLSLLYGDVAEYPHVEKVSALSGRMRFDAKNATIYRGAVTPWSKCDEAVVGNLPKGVVDWKDNGDGSFTPEANCGDFAMTGRLFDKLGSYRA